MRKYDKVSNKVKVIGIKKNSKMVDYYLVHPHYGREYAFTRKYTTKTYNLVKGGTPVKEVLTYRYHDRSVMDLIKYMKLMVPYFMEEIDWLSA